MADLYPEGNTSNSFHLNTESNLARFIVRHTVFGINPIVIYDLPPPPPPILSHQPEPLRNDETSSVTSSRANSVQPSDMNEARQLKLDRFNRPIRERTNSPDPRTIKQKVSSKRELPTAIMDFLAALPPASMFDGATFHIDELVKLIRNANVPYPTGFVMNSKRGRGSDDDDNVPRGVKKYRDD
jgi:Suppressor of forked protein (Suf)